MFKADIPTRWSGIYRYNPSEYWSVETPEVTFEMHLTLRWFGRFTGTIVEDENGIPEPAEITGSIVGNQIRFRKRYKRLWIADESGKSTSLSGQRSFDLFYEGELLDSRTRIVGTWNIPFERRIFNGEEWEFPEAAGTWDAQI